MIRDTTVGGGPQLYPLAAVKSSNQYLDLPA